jgi:hypothetical protein
MDQTCFPEAASREATKGLAKDVCYMLADGLTTTGHFFELL